MPSSPAAIVALATPQAGDILLLGSTGRRVGRQVTLEDEPYGPTAEARKTDALGDGDLPHNPLVFNARPSYGPKFDGLFVGERP